MSILFDKDWNKYPDAILHKHTKNKSFLEYVSLLDKMGVHNSGFCLALHNPDLEFVDPHSDKLTKEQKIMIAEECSENIWYIIREVIRIPPTSGDEVIPFKANRGNIAMIWSYYAGISYAAIQPRQTGKSVGADCITVANIHFLSQNSEMLLATKDEKLLARNIRRIKSIQKLLPYYLNPTSRSDADNSERITLNARKNVLTGLIAQKDRKAANNQGRGMTAPHIQYDEPPFQYNISEIIPAATSAGARARDDARRNGEPYGILYTTTPGDITDEEVRFVFDIVMSGAVMDERAFYDSEDYDDLRQRVLANGTSKAPLINGTFNHRQLGFTDEWLYDAITEAKLSVYKANMEFFNRWLAGTQSNLIPTDLQDVLNSSESEPVYLEVTRDKTFIYWQITEQELSSLVRSNTIIILGLDTSEAVNRDAIGGVLVHSETGHTLGRFTVNDDNLHSFGTTFLLDLMLRYPNILLIPEMKSSARGIIDAIGVGLIAHGIDPFKRIYNRIVQNASDSNTNTHRFEELKRRSFVDVNMFNNRRGEFGFVTTASSRSALYEGVLFKAIKALAPYIKDQIIVSEICSLSEKKGRVDHDTNKHDDHVIAWLLTQWLRYEGRNLDYYGIDHIDTTIRWNKKEEATVEEVVDTLRDKTIRGMIDNLRDQLEVVTDQGISRVLEQQMRVLYSQLSHPGGYGSMDEIMRGINERKALHQSMGVQELNLGDIWSY